MLVSLAGMTVIEAKPSRTMPLVEHDLSWGNEQLPQTQPIPPNPGLITDSPGIIVGYTYYDYQTNGSSGNRVAMGNNGALHFCWMNALAYPTPRHVYYNYLSPDGDWLAQGEGNQLSVDLGSGYTNIDIIEGYLAAVAYHVSATNSLMKMAIEDQPPGLGIFNQYTVPNNVYPQNPPDSPGILMWPYVTVDSSDRIHMVITENTERRLQRMCYVTSADSGVTWSTPRQIDTVMVISAVLDASPVSDKVVLAYSKPIDTTTQWNNDVVYYLSDDGETWDWRYGLHNVTNYNDDNDSLWAYTDIDAIFDYNDNLHLIWNAQRIRNDSIEFRTYLFHYNSDTEQINTISVWPDSLWMDIEGNWNRPICKMNLGVQEDGNIICATWTQFDTSDVSATGYGNGDLYISYTLDGIEWSNPENMTNSHTPGCYPGECDSDHWSTVADVVRENTAHVFYVNDKDAGGVPQTEGAPTLNPMLYLPFTFLGVEDDPDNRPINFSLDQNYPNPFNAKTTISFSMKKAGPVELRIYEVTGALVETLLDEPLPAGQHQVAWDAGDLASGIYFYKLTCAGESSAGKAVLLK